jgi:Zn-dependent protease
MDEQMTAKVYRLLFVFPLLLVSLAVHEAAHAWSAYKLGDDTAQRQGRLTLDPLKHIDPFGCVFMVLSSLSGIGFGWAKPVPVDMKMLRHPFRDMAIIAAAGPISNVLQAFVWLGILFVVKFTLGLETIANNVDAPDSFSGMFAFWGVQGILLNLFLAAFNMIPVPPLDGSRIAVALMPTEQKRMILSLEPFGFIILLVLLQLGIMNTVAQPVLAAFDWMLRLVVH